MLGLPIQDRLDAEFLCACKLQSCQCDLYMTPVIIGESCRKFGVFRIPLIPRKYHAYNRPCASFCDKSKPMVPVSIPNGPQPVSSWFPADFHRTDATGHDPEARCLALITLHTFCIRGSILVIAAKRSLWVKVAILLQFHLTGRPVTTYTRPNSDQQNASPKENMGIAPRPEMPNPAQLQKRLTSIQPFHRQSARAMAHAPMLSKDNQEHHPISAVARPTDTPRRPPIYLGSRPPVSIPNGPVSGPKSRSCVWHEQKT